MANVDIRLRVTQELKANAEIVFEQIGMNMSEALRIFLNQCVNDRGLPFAPHAKIPNNETLESFRQVEKGEYEVFTLDEFRKAWNIKKK